MQAQIYVKKDNWKVWRLFCHGLSPWIKPTVEMSHEYLAPCQTYLTIEGKT